jgi:hypothetical protein
MKKLLLSIILLLSAFSIKAQTQNDFIELLKSDMKSERKAIITESMNFTETESKAFWPIYNEYEVKLENLANQRIKNLQAFGENYNKLSEEKANELMTKSFKFQEDRLSLNKSYYKKFAKALSPTVAGKFMQVENQIQLIIDVTIAEELPLIKKPSGNTTK